MTEMRDKRERSSMALFGVDFVNQTTSESLLRREREMSLHMGGCWNHWLACNKTDVPEVQKRERKAICTGQRTGGWSVIWSSPE
mgnify:CR=1 FL=1